MPERENSIAIHTFTHDLLDPMLSTLTGYSRGSFWDLVDEKWFRDCLEYLRTAPQLDLIDLVNYTYDAHLFTNEDKSTYLRRLMSEREREKDYAESTHGLDRPVTDSNLGRSHPGRHAHPADAEFHLRPDPGVPAHGAKAREKVKSERYGLNMGALAAAVCVSMTDNFLKGGMSGLKTAIGWFNVLVMAAVLYGSYYVALLV
eukprot:jgi/Mesvir1/20729/Mv08604-RA.1